MRKMKGNIINMLTYSMYLSPWLNCSFPFQTSLKNGFIFIFNEKLKYTLNPHDYEASASGICSVIY